MNNEYQVTVVMFTYNHEKFIRQAVDSVMLQKTSFKFLLLVGDDASQDDTPKILREYKAKYPDKIEVVLREKNIGAMNNSIDINMRVKSKYIAVLEGDDFWCYDNKLQNQYEFMESHPEYAGVAHDYSICDEFGNILNEKNNTLRTKSDITFKDIQRHRICFHTSTLFSKRYDYSLSEKYMEIRRLHPIVGDQMSRIYLLNKGPVYVMSGVWSTYRKIVKKNGTNARSIFFTIPIESTAKLLKQMNCIQDDLKERDLSIRIAQNYLDLIRTMVRYHNVENKNSIDYARNVIRDTKLKYKLRALFVELPRSACIKVFRMTKRKKVK